MKKLTLFLALFSAFTLLWGVNKTMVDQNPAAVERTEFTVNFYFINGSASMYALANGNYVNSGTTVAAGANLEFYIFPDPSFIVQDWTVNGVAQNHFLNSFFYSNLQENLEVVAVLQQYNFPQINPSYQLFALSNPQDLVFEISYGSESGITSISRYQYDDENNQEIITPLVVNTDYTLTPDGDSLIILASYILNQDPEFNYYGVTIIVEFNSGYQVWLYVDIVQYSEPTFVTSTLTYDLTNPGDLYAFIIYATANQLTSLVYNGVPLNQGTDYEIQHTWLFIKQSFLSQHLQSQGQSISLIGNFDDGSTAELQISTAETGIINATLNPTSAEISQSEIEGGGHLDITINWNSASAVTGMMVKMADEFGVEQFPWENYIVTDNNNGTANLRIFFDENKLLKNKTKEETYYNYVVIEIAFDQGASANFFLTIYAIYYSVNVQIYPTPDAGYVSGAWNYMQGEDVYLNAYPAYGYTFDSWKDENGNILGTEQALSFTMPSQDLNLKAYFKPVYQVSFWPVTANGTIKAFVSGEEIASGSLITEGSTIHFVAVPDEGYKVDKWYEQSVMINYDGLNYWVENISSAVVVNVSFIQIPSNHYMVTYSVVGGNGTLEAQYNAQPLASGGVVNSGASVTFIATPHGNYRVKEWRINGSVVQNFSENQLLVENITATTNVTVQFEAIVSIGNAEQLPQIQLYPNPFRDEIMVISDQEIEKITITNIVGQIVKQVSHPSGSIATSDLSLGIYIFVVETRSGERTIRKLLKQ